MIDHRSSKVCAAAGPTCKHIHAGTVAIVIILESRRMILLANEHNIESTTQINEATFPHMKSSPTKKIMNTSGTMIQADFDFDLHTKEKHVASPHDLVVYKGGPRRRAYCS